jgi:hypothetical protein
MEEAATVDPRERGGGGSPTLRGPRGRHGGVDRPPRPNGRPAAAAAAPTPPRPRVRPGAPAAASKADLVDPFFLRAAPAVDILPNQSPARGSRGSRGKWLGARRLGRAGKLEVGEAGGNLVLAGRFGGGGGGPWLLGGRARGRRRGARDPAGVARWRRDSTARRPASARHRATGQPRRLI